MASATCLHIPADPAGPSLLFFGRSCSGAGVKPVLPVVLCCRRSGGPSPGSWFVTQ